jgi:hypothetical protein
MRTSKSYLIENIVISKGSKILERKQIGTLYHFTNQFFILQILKSRGLKSDKYDYISFTRNPRLGNLAYFGAFRFTFDGEKLSDTYHIEPFLDFKSGSVVHHAEEGRENTLACV